ncbi:carboxymuconolactone decarboxylase family protein [Nonomuraea sp. NN258]|uniref:carboxymuconolactone decarboxylase family protein n=1 Tax=Nonomuraea antri TaxID=2730852 RepID=UPI00156A6C01|nr:carboxymuconolactone decarboxylase family protein [Nonomuraea antri]NRQ36997.1 carboxymuconolactone decarboxylase family protein [Nonomuraea antri]
MSSPTGPQADVTRHPREPLTETPSPEAFRKARADGNERLRASGSLFESFFSLDEAAYAPGALPTSVKELLGLVVSVMKDCEECVYYHLERCDEEQVARDQVIEALQIALVGGGSVTIPLLRRAVSYMEKSRISPRRKRERSSSESENARPSAATPSVCASLKVART